MKFLLLIVISITSILTLSTPIRRNTKSPLYTPNDPCCNCLADFIVPGISFETGPMNVFPLGLSTLSFTSIGRR
ncbi:unnamed protein product [Adineta steineri]|uniref:Uncharacterized protein n=1 Tax=Adineta steineri TaxID=433720 RepID=A0A814Z1B2_9BILA|nr:unnamed protein product [Adineta steineri]